MTSKATSATLFAGASEMHARVNAHDWARTPVGPVERWPQSLRATIKTLLGSRYPMILLWGPELIQIYNEAYISLIGEKHPEALGRSIRETQSESWAVIGPMIHEVMSTGIPNWVPAQMLPLERSGYREESYFSLSYSAVEDDEGQIAGMLCVCSEVTQQVLGARRMRLLRDLAIEAGETRSVEITCRDVLAALSDHPLDIPFAALYLRGAAAGELALSGAAGLDARTREYFRSCAAGSDGAPGAAIAQAAAHRTALADGIDAFVTVDGGPWADPVRTAIAMPISSSDPSEPLGVLVAGVSPNRALDDGYSSFYELLVGQISVALRNARAYEDQRKRAEALAELDRAKTAFFSNISHEFRTPLTLMLGPLEDLLASGQLADAARGELELVHRNAERLLRLVNALLDFSRIEAGRIDLQLEPIDLATATRDLASSFRSATERAGLTLTVDCPPLREPISVDHEMWDKIVLNLLSNAFKFTSAGGITLRMRERESAVTLEVIDTGIGIPDSDLARVFERFHRVRGAHGRTHEGSGIGLALVHELVKLHGGTIEVSSAEGQGTAFTVTLPRRSAHAPADPAREPEQRVSTATRARAFVNEALRWTATAESAGAPRAADRPAASGAANATARARILVVDDNADMREYLTRVLSPSFDVTVAEDGQAALDLVQGERSFELVLSDVMMPRLGGFGLLRALREDPRTRPIPVLLLSARAGEEASIEGLEAGADDYLIKPFAARELIARTRSALELARMRNEVAARRTLELHLQQAIQARDEFLSIASHELRTPLTPLRLQIGALARQADAVAKDAIASAWLQKRLEKVRRHSDRLTRLVDELLEVSRVVSGQIPMTLEDVDLAAVVRAVVCHFEEIGAVAESRSEIRVHAPGPVEGRWDALRLEQVIANLLSNALKYGAASPIDISIENDGQLASLIIADGGIGIPEDAHERIFERFERAVTARHYGGFGVGLYVARRIVEQLGGTIRLKSAPGAGATFTITLPVAGPPPAARDGERESVSGLH